jgi:O-antigen ligase
VALLCLAQARSSTGTVIAAALTLVGLTLKARGAWRPVALVGAIIAVAAGLLGAAGLFELLGKDAGLNGRLAIWAAAWPEALQRPLTGLGYDYTGAPEAALRLRQLFGVYSVHSGYLDALICLGWGVSGLFALAVCGALQRAWCGPAPPEEGDRRAVLSLLLAGCLLSAVTESGVTHPSGPMQLLGLLAVFGLYAAGAEVGGTTTPEARLWRRELGAWGAPGRPRPAAGRSGGAPPSGRSPSPGGWRPRPPPPPATSPRADPSAGA